MNITTKEFRAKERTAREYKKLKEDHIKITKELEEKTEELSGFLKSCENNRYIDNAYGFALKYIQPSKPVFYIDELEKKIPVHLSRDIIKKKLNVNNEVLFVALMRRCGVPTEELNKCLTVEREVDKKALDQAMDIGDITREMIEHTFVIENKKAYIKVTDKT